MNKDITRVQEIGDFDKSLHSPNSFRRIQEFRDTHRDGGEMFNLVLVYILLCGVTHHCFDLF